MKQRIKAHNGYAVRSTRNDDYPHVPVPAYFLDKMATSRSEFYIQQAGTDELPGLPCRCLK